MSANGRSRSRSLLCFAGLAAALVAGRAAGAAGRRRRGRRRARRPAGLRRPRRQVPRRLAARGARRGVGDREGTSDDRPLHRRRRLGNDAGPVRPPADSRSPDSNSRSGALAGRTTPAGGVAVAAQAAAGEQLADRPRPWRQPARGARTRALLHAEEGESLFSEEGSSGVLLVPVEEPGGGDRRLRRSRRSNPRPARKRCSTSTARDGSGSRSASASNPAPPARNRPPPSACWRSTPAGPKTPGCWRSGPRPRKGSSCSSAKPAAARRGSGLAPAASSARQARSARCSRRKRRNSPSPPEPPLVLGVAARSAGPAAHRHRRRGLGRRPAHRTAGGRKAATPPSTTTSAQGKLTGSWCDLAAAPGLCDIRARLRTARGGGPQLRLAARRRPGPLRQAGDHRARPGRDPQPRRAPPSPAWRWPAATRARPKGRRSTHPAKAGWGRTRRYTSPATPNPSAWRPGRCRSAGR